MARGEYPSGRGKSSRMIGSGSDVQSPAISSLIGLRSATVFRQAAKIAFDSDGVRSAAGFLIASTAAWSIGGAAGAGCVVRLARKQPSTCRSPA